MLLLLLLLLATHGLALLLLLMQLGPYPRLTAAFAGFTCSRVRRAGFAVYACWPAGFINHQQ
jgi:hypothetical protein